MNNRTITLGAIGAVLVIAVWWMFVFSPIKTESSDAAKEVDVAKAETRTLETQLSQLEDLEAKGAETQARLEQLRRGSAAVRPRRLHRLGRTRLGRGDRRHLGVRHPGAADRHRWDRHHPALDGRQGRVLPSPRLPEPGGAHVRLVVIDGVTIDETGDENADEGGPSVLNATLNARMFSQAAATPTTSADGTTTPVAGGGGVAAPASGAQEN